MKKFISILLCLAMLLTMVTGCSQPAQTKAEGLKDGTYVIDSKGMSEGLKVEVIFKEGKINSVKVLEHAETPGISDPAIERIPTLIVENNTVNVDAVSGATLTSNGILGAVKKAIEQAGGKLESFNEPIAKAEKATNSIETEVVVVGGGIAGLSASLKLAENGAKVILLEKAAKTGGSFALAAGNFISVDSSIAKEAGVDDNLEASLKIWHDRADLGPKISTKYPNFERVEYMLPLISDTLDWLQEDGIVWTKVAPLGTELSIASAEGKGAGAAETLDKKVRELGVDVRTETAAIELITENGKVIGVKAQSPTEELEILAGNVILATGGFGNNDEMIAKYAPEFSEGIKKTAAGNTGDGFEMATAVGAALYEEFWMMPSAISPNKELIEINADAAALAFVDKALVNETGKRYVNESLHYSIVTNALATQETSSYVIFDSSDADVVAILEVGLEDGDVYKGNAIAELAENTGIDAAALTETIEKYNTYANTGVDEEFGKASGKMVAYADGPYYAVRFIPASLGTLAGVVTDFDCHVLNEKGEIIEGLYAIGEVTNKEFYNQGYLSAASLALYSTMGRIVGENLTK